MSDITSGVLDIWNWLVGHPIESAVIGTIAAVISAAIAVVAIVISGVSRSKGQNANERTLALLLERFGARGEKERKQISGSILQPVKQDPTTAIWSLGRPDESPSFLLVAPDTKRKSPRPPKSADYSYLTAFGDIDSIVETLVFLARIFPGAYLARFPSSTLTPEHRKMPLIAIGGPLGDDGIGGNQVAAQINDLLPEKIHYSFDPPALHLGTSTIPTEYNPVDGSICKDAGCIIRIRNPWRPECKALLFQGTHTFGVLGAVRALTAPIVAEKNTAAIQSVAGTDMLFCAAFPVQVNDGFVFPPIISPFSITKLNL